MNGEWQTIHFSEKCEDSAFGPRFSAEFYSIGGNVATLRTTDISEDGHINYGSMPLAFLDLTRLSKHLLQEDDLVITRSGRVGTTAVFGKFQLPVLPGAFLLRFRLKRELAEPMFYQYFFNSPAGQDLLFSVATGSAQQNLNITSLHRLQIPLPPLPEQRAIARILGSLDDKIEANRRMNETLEAMARALFKSWFVDFDPVRARADGRAPAGMDAETAALFPDSFEETEGRRVPRGWIIKSLDEIADFLNGLAMQKFPPEGEGFLPVIKIAEPHRGNTVGSDRASPNIDLRYIVDDGDILFSWSGSLDVCIWCGGIGALNQHQFKVTSSDYPKWFYYLWLKEHLTEFQLIAAGKATTMGHIQRYHLSEAKVVIPMTPLLEKADNIIRLLLQLILKNNLEFRDIASIRDILLPKLLSGEIRAIATGRY